MRTFAVICETLNASATRRFSDSATYPIKNAKITRYTARMMKCTTSTLWPMVAPRGVRAITTASSAIVKTTATVVSDVSRMPQRNAAASKAKMKYRKKGLLAPPAKRLIAAGQRISVMCAQREKADETSDSNWTLNNSQSEVAKYSSSP